MKIYEVEYRAVITLVEQDMAKAASRGVALIKNNPHLISVRAVHERNLEPASEYSDPKDSEQDSIVPRLLTLVGTRNGSGRLA